MSGQISSKRWILQILGMLLALAGVVWVMKSLQAPGNAVSDPDNPVGALLGVGDQMPTTTTLPSENLEDKVIRAKVKKDL